MKSETRSFLSVLASLCCVVGCGVTDHLVGTFGGAHVGSGGAVDTSGRQDGAGRSGAQTGGTNGGRVASGVSGSGGNTAGVGGVSLADGPSGNNSSGQGGRAEVAPDGGSAGFALAGAPNSVSAAGATGTDVLAPALVGGPCTALVATATSYVAHKTLTLVSPVPNVVGVAADVTSVWLLSATHGNGLATITRYGLPSKKILFQFQTRGFILASGTDLYGIEVSTDSVYLSVAGPGGTDISTFDAKSGDGTGDFESPFGWVPTGVGPSDLAFLDGKLLVGMGSGTLETIVFPPNFERKSFTSYTPDSSRDSGVATCNGFVLWGGLFQGITLLDRTGRAIGSVIQSDGQPFRQSDLGALAFFGNQLVIAAPDALAFYGLEAL